MSNPPDEQNLGSLAHQAYMAIDTSIRSRISEHEWMWMTDAQKADLERSELEPEH